MCLDFEPDLTVRSSARHIYYDRVRSRKYLIELMHCVSKVIERYGGAIP